MKSLIRFVVALQIVILVACSSDPITVRYPPPEDGSNNPPESQD